MKKTLFAQHYNLPGSEEAATSAWQQAVNSSHHELSSFPATGHHQTHNGVITYNLYTVPALGPSIHVSGILDIYFVIIF